MVEISFDRKLTDNTVWDDEYDPVSQWKRRCECGKGRRYCHSTDYHLKRMSSSMPFRRASLPQPSPSQEEHIHLNPPPVVASPSPIARGIVQHISTSTAILVSTRTTPWSSISLKTYAGAGASGALARGVRAVVAAHLDDWIGSFEA